MLSLLLFVSCGNRRMQAIQIEKLKANLKAKEPEIE